MALNWNLLTDNQVNPVNAFSQGYKTGAALKADRTKRNALAQYRTDPEGAINALAMEDPETALQLDKLHGNQRQRSARRAASPFLQNNDYAGAAAAVAPDDPDFAAQLFDMDKDALERAGTLGKRAGSVMLTAASIADPGRRRAFILEHRDEIVGHGIPADKFDTFNFDDVEALRTGGLRFLDLSDAAGRVTVEKFGDTVVPVNSSPLGVNFGDPKPIAETREQRIARLRLAQDREEFEYRKTHDADERDDRRRTPTGLLGEVLERWVNGEPLSAQQQQLVDRYLEGTGNDDGFDDEDPYEEEDVAAPPAPAVGPGKPVGSRANPARPATPADARNLPSGTFFLDPSGNLRQR